MISSAYYLIALRPYVTVIDYVCKTFIKHMFIKLTFIKLTFIKLANYGYFSEKWSNCDCSAVKLPVIKCY